MSAHKSPVHITVCQRTLDQLQQGQKTIMIFIDDRIFTQVDPGRELISQHPVGGRLLTVTKVINGIRRYKTIAEVLDHEDPKALGFATKEEALKFYSEIYSELPRDRVPVALDLLPTERRQRRNATKKSHD